LTKIPQRRVGGPAWCPGEPVVTVGEIARRIAPLTSSTADQMTEKIRHWTREQMLAPTHLHSGTGRHRTYPESAIYEAALLHILTNAGFTVSAMRYLVDALTQVRFALPKWLEKGGGPFYLLISRSGPTDRTEAEILWKEPGPPTADLTIVIDLARLLSRISRVKE
jgi:DNA-binding transcriptional MerR regulator